MAREQLKLNRMHILQLLLYAPGPTGKENEPVRGKTRLQKEMFIAERALRDIGIRRPHAFRPYIHGPFSRELHNDVYWLEFEEVIEEKPYYYDDGAVYYEFQLTAKGVREVEALLKDPHLRSAYETIKAVKRNYNQMNLAHLVNEIHDKYPDFVASYHY